MVLDHRDVGFLLERVAQALVLTDDWGRWLWVNQATVELLGRSRQSLVGRKGSEIITDWPSQARAMSVQTVYRRPHGPQRTLWIERLPLWLEHPYQLFAIYVLPPAPAYTTLSRTEGIYYRSLFDLLPIGITIADAAGKIVDANPASELILGVKLPSLLQHNLMELDSLITLPLEEQACFKAWKNRQFVANKITPLVQPNGSQRWLSVSAAPLPNGGVITTYIDITEQEKAKIALHQSQAKFQRIADMFPGVIYTVIEDENGPQAYEYLNPGFERIYGLKIEQVYQNPALVYAQIHPDDRASYQQAIRAAIAENKLFQHEWRILTPDGQEKWLQGCSQLERLDNGQICWHGIALDITDCKIAGLALQRQMAKERSLRRVMHAIRSSLDLEEIFTIAATTISREFQLEVHIVEYRAQEQCWRFRVACAKNGEIFSPAITEIPDAGNPFSQELKACRVVQVDDTKTIPDPINQGIREYFPGAWLLVPIVVDSQVWGSLSLMRLGEDARPWNPDEISLAQQLSQHLGLAIEQAQMHIQLQASQQELKWILENSPVVTAKLRLFPNYEAVCDYISPQCERLVGYRPEEFIADPNLFRRCVWAEDLRNVILATYDRIYQGETDHQIFYRFRHRNGHIVWIQEDIHVQPKGPEPYWLLMINTTDVTDLYSARAQIEELAKLN
ncbi:MAG: PAS domain S-box protein, partial [Anaerolineales bacterium]|nr:PAS domain S-box protein [Anaerolineales bacterium]